MRRPANGTSMVPTRCSMYCSPARPVSTRMRPTSPPSGRSQSSPMRASMAASSSSSSLCPPRDRNLMPLSGIGLCDAESTTPMSTPSSAVRNATAGVGSTPTLLTSTPAEARPADTAAARNSPDARLSRPDDRPGPVPLELAERGQHVRGRDREVERELGGDVPVGEPTHAVGTEQSAHGQTPSSSRGAPRSARPVARAFSMVADAPMAPLVVRPAGPSGRGVTISASSTAEPCGPS